MQRRTLWKVKKGFKNCFQNERNAIGPTLNLIAADNVGQNEMDNMVVRI